MRLPVDRGRSLPHPPHPIIGAVRPIPTGPRNLGLAQKLGRRAAEAAGVALQGLVDRFGETDQIGEGKSNLTGLILRSRAKARRLEGWPSFETRARARSSGRGLIDEIDMIRTSETVDQRIDSVKQPPQAVASDALNL